MGQDEKLKGDTMRYLKDMEFIGVDKAPIRMRNPKGQGDDVIKERALISDMLHWLLCSYNPMPNQQFVLDLNGLRSLNKAIDVLKKSQENEYIEFEDADWEIVKLVATKMAIFLSPRNAPVIADILEKASKEKEK